MPYNIAFYTKHLLTAYTSTIDKFFSSDKDFEFH